MHRKYFMLAFLLVSISLVAQNQIPKTFNNPIIPGFHPDPSICRVGDDYYLVNSSFEWFPGIPIFHSKDLVNWQQIGNVLDRPSQLMMDENVKASMGIWAPTIRYNKGTYYVIVTGQGCGGNFFVTSKDPKGPWSDPTFIEDSPGIDPELFFDDNGKVYYVGCSQGKWGGPRRWKWEDKIYAAEIDLETGKMISEKVHLTSGHASNARWCEGPHIFKRGDKYLLITGEGGTWEQHAVTVFEGDSMNGAFTPMHTNPVLTHRHLGNDIDITTTGHADLVQTQNGDWWSVMLAVRPIDGFRTLGRETFLTPVEFQGNTPIFNPGIGRVLMFDNRPDLPWHPFTLPPERNEFNEEKLGFEWCFLRTPINKWHELKNGKLIIDLRPEKITEVNNPSLIARRQEHFKFESYTEMNFTPESENEEAGMIAIQNERFNYRVFLTIENGKQIIKLIKTGTSDREKRNEVFEIVEASEPYNDNKVVFGMKCNDLDYSFYYGKDKQNLKMLGDVQDGRILSSNWAGGFTGTFIGMFATSNGKSSDNKAEFNWFEYLTEFSLSK